MPVGNYIEKVLIQTSNRVVGAGIAHADFSGEKLN